ncbi:hypothetical protein WMY93_024992 [Mugilogobius chulae]|uniref:Uncharacterized protein n=1 Tax=Mugilogobius chulae TaxID=88201 RepID=A0AAW0NB74_9GOBI
MDNFPEHLLSLDPPSQQEISQNLVGEEETWRRTTVKERSTHMDGQAVDVMLQTISMDHRSHCSSDEGWPLMPPKIKDLDLHLNTCPNSFSWIACPRPAR